MNAMTTRSLTLLAASSCALAGPTVNIDFEGDSTTAFAGDNLVLSSPGGTTWNSIPGGGSAVENLLDQFGGASTVGVVTPDGNSFNIPSFPNDNLRNGGSGGPIFIVGLDPDKTYDLALYVERNTSVRVADRDFNNVDNAPTENLYPGVEGADYFLLEDASPVFISADSLPDGFVGDDENVYGFAIDSDGGIVGAQIRWVPAPGAAVAMGLAGLAATRRRR